MHFPQARLRRLCRCNPYQSRANILELCRRYPPLLTGDADAAQRSLYRLYELARHRQRWRAQFTRLTPPLAATFLRDAQVALARVQYLLATDQVAEFSLRSVIKMGSQGWRRAFPEFEAWQTLREG